MSNWVINEIESRPYDQVLAYWFSYVHDKIKHRDFICVGCKDESEDEVGEEAFKPITAQELLDDYHSEDSSIPEPHFKEFQDDCMLCGSTLVD
ncbi:MAG: hypothetical protein ACXABG_12775 [Promethearchaeota archaeon]|jgi:hypothetical protein